MSGSIASVLEQADTRLLLMADSDSTPSCLPDLVDSSESERVVETRQSESQDETSGSESDTWVQQLRASLFVGHKGHPKCTGEGKEQWEQKGNGSGRKESSEGKVVEK